MINRELINPKSIVIVGASENIRKPGGKILHNILLGGYKGKLYAINPKEKEVQGVKCVNKEDLPYIELAIISVAVNHVKDYVEYLGKNKNTKAFIILSAGFGEMGEEGKKLEKEILDVVNEYKASLIGPNCIGVLTSSYNGIFAGPIPKLDPNGCDFVSGSGATAAFIIEKGIPMGITFASLFSVGNSAQVGVEEVLKYWDESFDPKKSSKIKLLYMENINKPDMLLRHASSLINKGCRIAAIKSGSSDAGSRAASSHTGALATPDKAVESLFKKAGIVRCYGREDLIYTAGVFMQKALKGKNIAVITHAGGPGVMLTDALSNGGLSVPKIEGVYAQELLDKLFPGSSAANPIDFLATGTAEQLGIIIDYTNDKFKEIDGMVVIFGSPGLGEIFDVYKVLHEKMLKTKKPIYPLLPSVVSACKEIEYFKSLGQIYFSDEVNLGRTLVNVANTPKPYIEFEEVKIDDKRIRSIISKAEDGYLSPELTAKILDAAGIDRIPEFVSENKDDVTKMAKEFGFPLVMKVVGPLHKSDVGGIELNIKTQKDVIKTFDRMMKIKDSKGVMIQPMISGREFFAGINYEGKFGHSILCGLGGIFIEVFKDTASSLAPFSKNKALQMVRSLKSYKIIKGDRGQKGIDENKFAEIVARLSSLSQAAPEIMEMDINPLIGNDNSLIAVDARIRVKI
ncbi:MAG: acetate--CoA ligase family protein [Candidatus Delongbacteria bacterium]|nr:acetate--CoA ligase family protein [Candidatus Delongbacteria bacterium]MCG2760256.1 acetate--CoA ligase family protein [Candidatus Delongbacteria bacterium]